MANTYLFTGFPGFIATQLVREIFYQGYPVDRIYLLHEGNMKQRAIEELEALTENPIIHSDKLHLIEGDITKDKLGIQSFLSKKMQQDVTHVFHLAAAYDLAVPLTTAWKINVHGTRNVTDWLRGCNELERHVYFSTAYVSGSRENTIYETELEHDQGFKNHYEYTKYEAERIVNQTLNSIPSTIIRPGIVTGHSKTGETAKFDGAYFIMNMLHAARFMPVHPLIGKGDATVNLVPVDYVVQATIQLAHHAAGEGQTYHLTDPTPYTAREIHQLILKALLNREPAFTLPLKYAETALSLPPVRRRVKFQKEALAYFTCHCRHDSTQAQRDLAGTPIQCPDMATVIPELVAYYKQHKHKQHKHVSIY
ncbi:SDR family oxidoreductase [Thalassobacillus sp. CUG 92003]|uniref:SDR family oxidoreductase n=1 Tax=Thalassobacillus sp. CUG 92003 TaxID=2736641 RepID=UPI0015E7419B|nr:SDR family oxidoreductase [Thalassobacillus sp. CUG 92003]